MKAGMILGIVGGVIALLIGAVGYGASSALGSLAGGVGYAEGASTMQFYSFMSIALPIAGLIGSGFAGKSLTLGIALMGSAAVGIIGVFGFGILSFVPAALLGLGAVLVWSDNQSGTHAQK